MGYGNAFSSYIGGDAPPTSGQTNYLDVYWPTTTKSTSCHVTGKIYFLGPPNTDRDEWDEGVILHEYGHYIMYLFVDPNIPSVDYHGDGHRWDSHEDPVTAYKEGWANYFGAATRRYKGMADPHIYTDNYGTGTGTINFEEDCSTNAVTDTWNDSESTVTCILWDINDTPNDDQNTDGVGDSIDRGVKRYMRFSAVTT